MKVDEPTLLEMLEEVAPKQFEEGDLTVSLVCEQFGVSKIAAQTMLAKLVDAGKAEKVWGYYGPTQRCCFIWKKIE